MTTTFHPTALFGTQTRYEVLSGELADLQAQLANPRSSFAGTVWHSRREARQREAYLTRLLK